MNDLEKKILKLSSNQSVSSIAGQLGISVDDVKKAIYGNKKRYNFLSSYVIAAVSTIPLALGLGYYIHRTETTPQSIVMTGSNPKAEAMRLLAEIIKINERPRVTIDSIWNTEFNGDEFERELINDPNKMALANSYFAYTDAPSPNGLNEMVSLFERNKNVVSIV